MPKPPNNANAPPLTMTYLTQPTPPLHWCATPPISHICLDHVCHPNPVSATPYPPYATTHPQRST